MRAFAGPKFLVLKLFAMAAIISSSVIVLGEREAARAAFPGANGKIAFQQEDFGGGEIYSMNPDGTDQVALTDNLRQDEWPAWSPDGSLIAYAHAPVVDGPREIFVMTANGSNKTNLTNHFGYDENPAWSSDGTRIAFDSLRVYPNRDIYVMNADGSSLVQLTSDAGINQYPAWSPDGSKIAFTSNRDGDYEIYMMNADGTNQTRLTNSPGYDWAADWHPTSPVITFTSDRDGNSEVYVMNADGTVQANLTNNSASDGRSAWSPEGAKIAFGSNRVHVSDAAIYTMNADGSNQTRLSGPPEFPLEGDHGPDWQPAAPSPLPDSDADGCTDYREIVGDAEYGGQRAPDNFWDFFDTPDASNIRDKAVAGPDFFRILQRFGSSGDNSIDPLSVPSAAPAYHTAFDRGPSSGPNPWNLTAADGSIAGTDFFAVLAQFGHSCA